MATGRFLSEIDVRQLAGGRLEMRAPLTYIDEDGTPYTVPFGFVFDGESTPRLAWFLWPKVGKGLRAGAVHDWLCHTKQMDSDKAHALYRRALKACGVNKLARAIKLWSVKAGGPNFKAQAAV